MLCNVITDQDWENFTGYIDRLYIISRMRKIPTYHYLLYGHHRNITLHPQVTTTEIMYVYGQTTAC